MVIHHHQHTPNISELESLLLQQYELRGELKHIAGEIDYNFSLTTISQQQYVVKVAASSRSVLDLEMENQALLHLAQPNNLKLQLPKLVPNTNDTFITELQDDDGNTRLIRVLTWIQGRLFADVKPHTDHLLQSLGQASARLCMSLLDFDHPSAHKTFKWDISQGIWIEKHFHLFTDTQKRLVQYFYDLFLHQALPLLPSLPQSVIHNDANDYNVLVDFNRLHPTVLAIIDYGDMVYTHTVNDLAVALAYAIMDKPDPLQAAAAVVQGSHTERPLSDTELTVLFPCIAMRLLLSVTISTMNAQTDPTNHYLQISATPAWALLSKLHSIHPNLAYYTFRNACHMVPCPNQNAFLAWTTKKTFAPLFTQLTPYMILDCSVQSLDLGISDNFFEDQQKLDRIIQGMMQDNNVQVAIGPYAEIRPFYTTDNYSLNSNNGPQWRTAHMGIDIFMQADTPFYAPFQGVVHSFQNNTRKLDYGPTIILEHHIAQENFTFYTLYGHLSLDSLHGLHQGKTFKQGDVIGKIGSRPSNGDWPPHVHFQVILDILGNYGDFPGAALPAEWNVWSSICPDPNAIIKLDLLSPSRSKGHSINDILQKRKALLGRGLSVSYQHPLKIVRGFRQHLYDETGRRYLDLVNNVAHVGHQHPKVVRAAQRQMAVLNTNTRYLYDHLVDYAQALLSKFPPELCVCHFVNSGSEANELALRMARTYTGQHDMIVVDVGYHGNTGATIEVSSYKFDGKGGTGAKSFIHTIPMPDTYRGLYGKDDPKAGEKYAVFAQVIIEKLRAEGKGIAGFIAETILSCGGQIEPPPQYFETIYEQVRKAGGVCIADEVQVGFGRVGTHFWGFELQNVIPDIVTMGKPIGNGHPLGAVVTTRKIADAFANGMEYFNTFGGNPVSCAIGLAVLKVIEEENLQDNAFKTGFYLQTRLMDLMHKYAIIGDVRGRGLFLGFELVEDRESLTPAEAKAAYLVNRARECGILLSTDGPLHNVIKIKPPIILNQKDVDFVIDVLDCIFQEDFMRD